MDEPEVASRLRRTQSWVSKFEDRVDAELTLGEIQAYCRAVSGSFSLTFGRRARST